MRSTATSGKSSLRGPPSPSARSASWQRPCPAPARDMGQTVPEHCRKAEFYILKEAVPSYRAVEGAKAKSTQLWARIIASHCP